MKYFETKEKMTTEEKMYFILGFIMFIVVSSFEYNLMMLCVG